MLQVDLAIWDMAMDQEATTATLAFLAWECVLAAVPPTTHLSGPLVTTVAPGQAVVHFTNLTVTETAAAVLLTASCTSMDFSQTVTTTSPPLHFYPAPETGLLRQTQVALVFRGPYSMVKTIVDTFPSSLGSLSCKGCPGGTRGSGAGLDLEAYCPCYSPIYQGPPCEC